MSLKIGKTELCHGVMLAPMAGVTDRSFRKLCKKAGAEYTVSEMVSAKALCYEQKSKRKEYTSSATAELATVLREDTPMSIQIFGSEPSFMAEAARLLEAGNYRGCRSDALPAAIDINMGCPVRKITSNGEGSALMKDPELAEKIATAVVKSISLPVTVKIRAGWDANSINAVEIAKRMENAGVSAICVHARTREQLYSPGINMDIITKVKRAVCIPVIGNGDIYSAQDALKMFNETSCDGIMIGRGAMGNPWIFSQICAALEEREFIVPSLEERLTLAKEHLLLMLDEHGEKVGFAQAKKQMSWYIAGIHSGASARNRIMNSENVVQVFEIFDELLNIHNNM